MPLDPVLWTARAEQLLLWGCSEGAAATSVGSLATRAEDGALLCLAGRAWGVPGLGAQVVVLGCRVTLGRGRGASKVLFPISSVNNLYIFGSNDSVFTVFGDSVFCIVTAWQRGLWVLFRFIFYIKDLFL